MHMSGIFASNPLCSLTPLADCRGRGRGIGRERESCVPAMHCNCRMCMHIIICKHEIVCSKTDSL